MGHGSRIFVLEVHGTHYSCFHLHNDFPTGNRDMQAQKSVQLFLAQLASARQTDNACNATCVLQES